MANMSRSNMPKFDAAGNVIMVKPKKPEVINKVKVLEKELDKIINGKEKLHCSFCNKKWKSDVSRLRHEAWCPKNSNHRTSYRKPVSEVKEKPKKPKIKIKGKPRGRPPKMKPIKDNNMIKELKAFDKIFGLTDEQIAKYIRGKMK